MRAVEHVLRRPTDIAERPRVDEVQVDLPLGLRVAWGDAVVGYYNLTFTHAHDGIRHSVSVRLRPDIVIQVGDTMHVRDGKLRIDARRRRGEAPQT